MKLKAPMSKHQVEETAQHGGLEHHVAEARAVLPLTLLGALPHLGLADPQADEQRQRRRDRGAHEQPAPAEDRVDDEERDRREHVADRIALLEDAREEPALLR